MTHLKEYSETFEEWDHTPFLRVKSTTRLLQ